MPSILNATTSSGLVTSADNSGSLQLATNNGTTAVTIDTSQNVGIGTASPAAKLHVSNTSGSIQARVSSDTDVSVAAIATGTDSTAFMTVINDARQWTLRVNGAESDQFQVRDSTAGATRMTLDSSGNLGFNSGYGSVATAYGCRAWVNFNGTGTIAIRASGNVSSLTDNGQGDYTVNFTTAMPDANYLVSGVTSKNANTNTGVFISSQATGNVRVLASVTDGLFDQPTVCVEVVR